MNGFDRYEILQRHVSGREFNSRHLHQDSSSVSCVYISAALPSVGGVPYGLDLLLRDSGLRENNVVEDVLCLPY